MINPSHNDFYFEINGDAIAQVLFEGAQTIGIATTNGALCLLETSFASRDSLLETAEQILMSACKGSGMPQLESLYRVHRHPYKDSKIKLYICQSLREHRGLRARYPSFSW